MDKKAVNKLKEFYECFRKEKRIPIWKPHYNQRLPFYMLSKWRQRNIKHYDGFRAYKEHIKRGYDVMPVNYIEFKKGMKFYYGWEFGTVHE